MSNEPAASTADSTPPRPAAATAPLTSALDLERYIQRRMFWFNVCFVMALSPLYIGSALARAETLTWWMTVLIFGSVPLNVLWTLQHGDFRRGLFWLQSSTFFVLTATVAIAQSFSVDLPAFWWMSVIPMVTLMSGLTGLGIAQGSVVVLYAGVAFLVHAKGEPSVQAQSVRLHLAVILSTLYVCANLVFASFWRGKLQTALHEATSAALASAGAKARFLAHMSHEIRTPLNGVIGAAELLRSGRIDDAQRQQLAKLQALSAKTLLTLINDILDWSKLEAGKVQLEQQPFSIRSLVSEADELFTLTSLDKPIKLTHSCDAELPGLLLGDPTRIRQVLYNLVGNAVKFTAQGSVHIHARATESWLRIDVADSGAGIAPDALDAVFDAFRQADQSVTRRYGGTGLGLSISKELAELMGGRIELKSVVGSGSTFTLVLPLRPAPQQPPAAPAVIRAEAAEPEAAQVQADPVPGPHVLLCEDNPVNQVIVQVMLKDIGATVELAGNGSEGLARLKAGERFDLVLMDMQMPEMDGISAAREWRRVEPSGGRRLPIVCMTANARADEGEAVIAAGMDDFLAKPFAIKDLEQCLARWAPQAVRA